jgi:hypothetical protein
MLIKYSSSRPPHVETVSIRKLRTPHTVVTKDRRKALKATLETGIRMAAKTPTILTTGIRS